MTNGRSLTHCLIILTLSLTSPATAGNADRAYFCESEAAGGIFLENASKGEGKISI
jgi:hypothetical protein